MISPKDKINIDPVKNAIRALKKLRKGITLGNQLSIKKMAKKGRYGAEKK